MRSLQRNRNLSPSHQAWLPRFLLSPLGLLLWISLCGFLTYGLLQSVGAMKASLVREQDAKKRLADEEKRALDLIDKLNQADTPFAKEKIVRDQLQLQQPGETVLQIPQN